MSEDSSTKPSSPTKRACDFCRRRKIKCTGDKVCPPCIRLNKGICTYDSPILKRGPKGSRTGSSTSKFEEIKFFTNPTVPTNASEFSPSSTSPPQLSNKINFSVPDLESACNSTSHIESSSHFEKYSNIDNISESSITSIPQNEIFYQDSSNTILEVPDRDELKLLENWPVSNVGIDFVKLVLFLGNLPNDKLNTNQVTSIVCYLTHFHPQVPLIDLDTFLFCLTRPFSSSLKILLNNLKVINRLSEIDMVKTESAIREAWSISLETYFPGDATVPFHLATYVLDSAIARLAHLLM